MRGSACFVGVFASAGSKHTTDGAKEERRRVLQYLAAGTVHLFLGRGKARAEVGLFEEEATLEDGFEKYPALRVGRRVVIPEWDEDKGPASESRVEVGDGRNLGKVLSVYLARTSVIAFVGAFVAFGMAVSDREAGRSALPDKYDPAAVARYFRIRPDKVAARMMQFAAEFSWFGARFALDRLLERMDNLLLAMRSHSSAKKVRDLLSKLKLEHLAPMLFEDTINTKWLKNRSAQRRGRQATDLREGITRLGPAVIKLGQAAASRPDLFDAAIVRELQKLQDDIISSFPTEEAFRLIENELGAPPHKIFDSIDPNPVAGASLGMVFKASVDGTPVAVKVQRPGVAENIALDFYIVRWIVNAFRRVSDYRTELANAVDEYASRLFEELDYTNEVQNMLRFQEIYGRTKGIYIPKPFPMYSSRKVLVAEWVDGIKLIDDECRVRVEELQVVETGIRFALTQLLDKGFLHAGK